MRACTIHEGNCSRGKWETDVMYSTGVEALPCILDKRVGAVE